MSADGRLVQCTELEYILLGDLRDLLDEPRTDDTVRWLESVIDTLLETIPETFALKSEDGYLSEVLVDFPNWEGHVSRLETEHDSLFCRLQELRSAIRDGDYKELASELEPALADWMSAFRTFHSKERQLMMLAANLEVGGD